MFTFLLSSLLMSSPAANQAQSGDGPTTQPIREPDQVEKFNLKSDDETHKEIVAKLGVDVIDEVAFSAYLWGYQRRFVPMMLSRYLRFVNFDLNGKVTKGIVVKPITRDPTLTWAGDTPFVTVKGTIEMYVPGKAAAIDFNVVITPIHPNLSQEPNYYSTKGKVEWSNLRDIPYTDDVWRDDIWKDDAANGAGQ